MKHPLPRALSRVTARLFLALASGAWATLLPTPAAAQDTIDAGVTGFDARRPVMATACAQGCPWGELGDFVTEALKPFGYEVIQCRNCNRDLGPRIVSAGGLPPEISAVDVAVGTTTRVSAPVDFGVTESGLLAWAYGGLYDYAEQGPYENLRLIAKIDDPTYLLVAVHPDSGIADLSQIAEQRLPVRIIGGDSPIAGAVLEYYGITAEALDSWGGNLQNAIVASVVGVTEFDVIVNELASPAQNLESSIWTTLSQRFDLEFLDLPEDLLDSLASRPELDLHRVTAKWGLLRGVDRAIPTVARSGEAVFARDDAPEQAAYDIARAIDAHRAALKWYIRPYSYDPGSVWENQDVPLHPGAARYYREVGYLTDGPGAPCPATCRCGRDGGIPSRDAGPDASRGELAAAPTAGCACVASGAGSHAAASWMVLIGFVAFVRRVLGSHRGRMGGGPEPEAGTRCAVSGVSATSSARR